MKQENGSKKYISTVVSQHKNVFVADLRMVGGGEGRSQGQCSLFRGENSAKVFRNSAESSRGRGKVATEIVVGVAFVKRRFTGKIKVLLTNNQ